MEQDRARDVYLSCRLMAACGPWSDYLDLLLTRDERAFVDRLWGTMPGSTCFVDAFLRVVQGHESALALLRELRIRPACSMGDAPLVRGRCDQPNGGVGGFVRAAAGR